MSWSSRRTRACCSGLTRSSHASTAGRPSASAMRSDVDTADAPCFGAAVLAGLVAFLLILCSFSLAASTGCRRLSVVQLHLDLSITGVLPPPYPPWPGPATARNTLRNSKDRPGCRAVVFCRPFIGPCSFLPACQLDDLNEVATGVIQLCDGRAGHLGWR